MHKKVQFWSLVVLLGLMGLVGRAQDSAAGRPAEMGRPVEMADRLRADGKIYVVIAVLVTIFIGIIAYVIRLDRKISRLEKGSK